MPPTDPLEYRVCHLMAPGPTGGAERVVICGTQTLAARDVHIQLSAIRDVRVPDFADVFLEQATAAGVPLGDVFTSRGRIDFELPKRLRSYLIQENVNILHTHGYKAFFVALMAGRGRGLGRGRLRIVHTHHGDTSRTWVTRVYQWLAYRSMPKAAAVVAVSRRMFEDLRGRHKNIRLVENMLVLPDLGPPSNSTPTNDGKPLTLVAVGRLSAEKGLDVLLHAMSEMTSDRPQLVVVGNGPQEATLRELSTRLGLDRSVTFEGFQRNVVPYLRQADGLVMPSFREGLPLSLVEAASMGLPVVASNVGGIPSVVEHGKNGLLCAPNNVPELVGTLQSFVRDFVSLQGQASEYVPAIRERFSPETWADNTLKIYEDVLRDAKTN